MPKINTIRKGAIEDPGKRDFQRITTGNITFGKRVPEVKNSRNNIASDIYIGHTHSSDRL
jgi:hypothetical protein